MESYDVIIIGGGPAGLTAGIYNTRGGLKTLLVEKITPGGQANWTYVVENYPGFPEGTSGPKLMQDMQKQAEHFGLKIISEEVLSVSINGDKKVVKTSSGEYEAKAVIVATGARPQKLGVPGEDAFTGKGISYCATCDGPLFRNKGVLVIGGGDAAIEEALFLTAFAEKVTIIHRRDKLRASKILEERAFANKKISFIWDSVVEEIKGEKMFSKAAIKNVKTGDTKDIPADGMFIFIGTQPDTGFIEDIVNTDETGYILTDENMQSSAKGVFACGDVRKKLLRQIVTACGEGATAAVAAEIYINSLKG
ncbi:MAG: thioredoxin-disulfide reductase [bacterium]